MRSFLLSMLIFVSLQTVFAQQQPPKPYYYDYQTTKLKPGIIDATLETLNTENLTSLFQTIKNKKTGKDEYYYKLVSKYSFRTLIKNDFAKLTGTDNSATVGQYAALSIDPNTYKLTFSPYAWVPTSSVLKKRDFNNILSFDVSATLNNQSILDLKEWRKVTVGFSWTRVFGVKYAFLIDNGETEENHKRPYRQLYQQLKTSYMKGFEQAFEENKNRGQYEPKDRRFAINHSEFSDVDALTGSYLDSVAFYEQAMVKAEWSKKTFWWTKVTFNGLSFDNADYTVKNLPETNNAPLSKATYTPSVNASINNYWGFATKWSLYWNLNAQIGIKNTFSGVYTATTYYNITQLTDQAYLENKKKSIYQLATDDVQRKLLPDFGGQFIVLYGLKSIGFGLDVSYSNKFAISNINAHTGYISSPTVGFIVGLKDKTGKSSVNIEPFFNYLEYRNIQVDNVRLWGVKFSVPINSLF